MLDKLKDDLWLVLKAAKPVTEESALAVAAKFLAQYPNESFKFGEWFRANGKQLVERINA